MDKFECDICGKTFKSEAGLVGHKRLSHDEGRIKTTPDKIGERLEALEAIAASGINPSDIVDSEEKVVDKLKLLLPSIEKYGLAVVSIPKDESTGWLVKDITKYRIVKNSDIRGGFGNLNIKTGAKEL